MSKIQFYFEDIDSIKIDKSYLRGKIEELITREIKCLGEISVIFCSDKYLLEINKKYLNHNYFTDIITFDYVENEVISGDLFISLERVKYNAATYKCEFITELYRVVFHGVLHLIGYKDKSDADQIKMKEREEYYLKQVDFRKVKL